MSHPRSEIELEALQLLQYLAEHERCDKTHVLYHRFEAAAEWLVGQGFAWWRQFTDQLYISEKGHEHHAGLVKVAENAKERVAQQDLLEMGFSR